jgi:UDP-N-acetylmuramoyl-L-alanyl-D-glutamate--2,6-diaminopimelate ligase
MSVTVDALVDQLAAHHDLRTVPTGDGPLMSELVDATHDSRAVVANGLFCCVPGAEFDGHDFAGAAVEAGAAALLVERPLEIPHVPQIIVDSVRAAMGPAAAIIHDHPSHDVTVLGVTGTNGKTSVVHLLEVVLSRLGRRVDTIGTLSGVRTTPEGPELQRKLADSRRRHREIVAMEVSSHALDMHRVDGTRFGAAIFTNLGHDHLDHHGTIDAYFEAKARLFTSDFTSASVINLDDPRGRELAGRTDTEVIGYGLDDVEDLTVDGPSSRFVWRGLPVELRLAGAHNVSNALAVAAVARHLGADDVDVADALCAVDAPRGRFEFVNVGQAFHVVVDYAHKPEALGAVLDAARTVADGHRVILVVGCGGDRDRSKRPIMAGIGEAKSDELVLTSDNPRSEDPVMILDEMVAGLRHTDAAHIEQDRATAIGFAVGLAQPGDVVLIAGKGHETHQVIGDEIVDFDDRLVAATAIAEVIR